MEKSKDDIKYGAAQAKLSDDEMLRVRYKHGTPLEGGKIAESEPVDLFSSAHNVARAGANDDSSADQPQANRPPPDEPADDGAGGRGMTIPKNKTPSTSIQSQPRV